MRPILLATLFLAFSTFVSRAEAQTSVLRNFNDTGQLVQHFNSDGTPVFTNLANGGLNDSGSVNVPLGSNDLWVTKQGYSNGGVGSVYQFSAYFKIKANAGRGGLGFSKDSPSSGGVFATPSSGIGVTFHGGGGEFINNGAVLQNLSWPPDLVLGNWYWMKLRVTVTAANTFDLNFQIWNSDATGTLGTMKTEKTYASLVNTSMGGATVIYGFFSADGSRMEKIDDFKIELDGGAGFVEEGTPVVLTSAVQYTSGSSASTGGTVSDDRGAAVTVRGVCRSIVSPPTTSDTCTTDGAGLGTFTSTLSGLAASTTYFVRAYATNSNGTSYGDVKSFTTGAAAATPTPTPTQTPTSASTPVPTATATSTPTIVPPANTAVPSPLPPSPNPGDITGIVLNPNLSPASGVGVYLYGDAPQASSKLEFTRFAADSSVVGVLSTVTNERGEYRFTNVPAGSYKIIPNYTGMDFVPAILGVVSTGRGDSVVQITATSRDLNDSGCTRQNRLPLVIAADGEASKQLDFARALLAKERKRLQRSTIGGARRTSLAKSLDLAGAQLDDVFTAVLNTSETLPKLSLVCPATRTDCSEVALKKSLGRYQKYLADLRRLTYFVVRRSRLEFDGFDSEPNRRTSAKIKSLYRSAVVTRKKIPQSFVHCDRPVG